jgi:hypothetical protein
MANAGSHSLRSASYGLLRINEAREGHHFQTIVNTAKAT